MEHSSALATPQDSQYSTRKENYDSTFYKNEHDETLIYAHLINIFKIFSCEDEITTFNSIN